MRLTVHPPRRTVKPSGSASILPRPVDFGLPTAGLFPDELTALRVGGLVLAAILAAFAISRRRSLRNGDVLILLGLALGLALVSGTELLDTILSAFSFERENGTRIVGVAVFAILINGIKGLGISDLTKICWR